METSFKDLSLEDKFFFIIDYPMGTLMKFTIPPCVNVILTSPDRRKIRKTTSGDFDALGNPVHFVHGIQDVFLVVAVRSDASERPFGGLLLVPLSERNRA